MPSPVEKGAKGEEKIIKLASISLMKIKNTSPIVGKCIKIQTQEIKENNC